MVYIIHYLMASIFDQLRDQSRIVVDKIYGMKSAQSDLSIVSYTAPWVHKVYIYDPAWNVCNF